MPDEFFRVTGLLAGYGDVTVLWGVDFDLRRNEIVCLVGSNGAGKTTFLRRISALLRPMEGTITFDGIDLTHATAEEVVAAGIAHVPEGRRLFPAMSVRDNLLMGAYMRRDSGVIREDLDRVFTLFPRLAERRGQDAGTLSGGEQQMCAIARGIMSRPALLMIDELSLGLAPRVIDDLGETMLRINESGVAILLVEQDVAIAFELAHRGFVMVSGRVTLSGPTAELARDPTVREAYMGIA